MPLVTPHDLFLKISVQYRVVENRSERLRRQWRISTASYWYTIEDKSGHEVVAYHWHPGAEGAVKTPHVHLGFGLGQIRAEFQKKHLPTGRVALEDILRCLITEFGVSPLRADWDLVLRRTLHSFERSRSWH